MASRPPGAGVPVRSLFLTIIAGALIPIFSVGLASEWQGTRVIKDGVEYVMNPAEPMDPPLICDLQEAWTLESETEEGELVFGTVDDVAVDEHGDTCLLDSQLKTVHVVSPEGEYLRAIGRAGEGPGELRHPAKVISTRDDQIGIADLRLGRISLYARDGKPLGEWRPQITDYSRTYLRKAFNAPTGFVLSATLRRYPEGMIEESNLMALFDQEGQLVTRFLDVQSESTRGILIPFDEEAELKYILLGVDGEGRVYVSEGYRDICINVFNPDGSLQRVITQEFEPAPRSRDEIDEEKAYWAAYFGNHKDQTLNISACERSVSTTHIMSSGTIWLSTSWGWKYPPEGVAQVLEEFDSSGRFLRRVVLRGNISPMKDIVYLVGDKYFVVREGHTAQLSAVGAEEIVANTGSDGIPAVTCYQIVSTKLDASGGPTSNQGQ